MKNDVGSFNAECSLSVSDFLVTFLHFDFEFPYFFLNLARLVSSPLYFVTSSLQKHFPGGVL